MCRWRANVGTWGVLSFLSQTRVRPGTDEPVFESVFASGPITGLSKLISIYRVVSSVPCANQLRPRRGSAPRTVLSLVSLALSHQRHHRLVSDRPRPALAIAKSSTMIAPVRRSRRKRSARAHQTTLLSHHMVSVAPRSQIVMSVPRPSRSNQGCARGRCRVAVGSARSGAQT